MHNSYLKSHAGILIEQLGNSPSYIQPEERELGVNENRKSQEQKRIEKLQDTRLQKEKEAKK